MKRPTIEDFKNELGMYCKRYFPEAAARVEELLSCYIKLRILISPDLFIAIRYNAQNGRQDFQLIYRGERVFGIDNLKQWHYHPPENPEAHVPCLEPSLEEVFCKVKEVVETGYG